ncbi:MAG: hypothetical protein STSR0004_19950 [Peptococcaceae bacterium]
MWFKKTRRYRYLLATLAILISLGLLFSSLPLGALGTAEASITDDLAARLIEIYAFIDDADKSILQDRQNKVASLTDVNIIKPAYNKMPASAKNAFGSANDALEMVKDAGKITYSSDPSVLKGKLDAYHNKWGPKVAAAFNAVGHPSVKIEDLEELALDTEAEVPGVIDEVTLANLISNWKTKPQAVEDQLTAWLKEALQKALTKPGNKDIKDALAALNLNVDDLVGIKTRLVLAVDAPGYEGEKALAKAYLRSQAKVTAMVNGADKGVINKAKPLNMYVGDKAAIELRVFDWTLQNLINWSVYSGPADVITLSSPTLTANKTGTVEVRGYSYKGDPDAKPATDWICRFDVNVTSAPSGGGGGGGGITPTPVPGETSKSIGKDGGSISLGDVNIEIPPGALEETKNISIKKLEPAKAPLGVMEGFKFLGDVYCFGPEGLKFKVPVTITFKYDPAKLTGLDEDTLAIYYYDQTKNAWVIQESAIDKAKRTVSTKINHFSCFVLMAKTKIPPTPCEFKDLTNEHWAYACIITLCAKGIVAGYPDKTFRPGNNITRAEFAKLIVGALGIAKEMPSKPTFMDVQTANWHYGYVEAAAKAGLIKGYKGKFRPNDFITRQEITAIMIRATGKESEALAKAQEKIDLADAAQISSWARGYVSLAATIGLIEGYPDKTFMPKKNTTRAEAAILICRFLEKSKL